MSLSQATPLLYYTNRKICTHPLLKVPVCKGCHTTYHTGEFTICKSPFLPASPPSPFFCRCNLSLFRCLLFPTLR